MNRAACLKTLKTLKALTIGGVVLCAMCLPLATHAQTVWRCGPEGNSYSQTPCDGGQAFAVADERSPEQVSEALEVAARNRRLADRLSAERRLRETPPAPAIVRKVPARELAAVKAATDAAAPLHRPRKAKPVPASKKIFRAIGPATPRTKG